MSFKNYTVQSVFYIIIHNIKQQITENEENLLFGKKVAQVSVVT